MHWHLNQNAFNFVSSAVFDSSNPTLFSLLAWATVGGCLVFAGLVLEKVSGWMNDRFLGGWKPHKSIEDVGWSILMIGILIEILAAGTTAVGEWRVNNEIKGIKNDITPRWIKFNSSKFCAALNGKPKCHVELLFCQGDLNSEWLAEKLASNFKSAGWTVVGTKGITLSEVESSGAVWGAFAFVVKEIGEQGESDEPLLNISDALAVSIDRSGWEHSLSFLTSENKKLPIDLIQIIVPVGESSLGDMSR